MRRALLVAGALAISYLVSPPVSADEGLAKVCGELRDKSEQKCAEYNTKKIVQCEERRNNSLKSLQGLDSGTATIEQLKIANKYDNCELRASRQLDWCVRSVGNRYNSCMENVE
jgi:hypothetical protein